MRINRKKPRVLVLEPYYGGSHRAFLKGLQKNIPAKYMLFTLPARKWKMRMQLSAPWFAAQIKNLPEDERYFDTVLCSTFVDVAVLRSLLVQVYGWNPAALFCTYFHENQFAYPGQLPDPSIFQFAAINFMTVLASDRIAFNSEHNRNSFLTACEKFISKARDMTVRDLIPQIKEKTRVLHPGIDYSEIDQRWIQHENEVPVILWNHRWEHDKNPEEFFNVLQSLKSDNIDFHLILLGESYKNQPNCFNEAENSFSENLIHYGYVKSKQEYAEMLCRGDIVVSTSLHEFFGISVLEAVRARCHPLLPARLSYPELFPVKYLYNDGELENRLKMLLETNTKLDDRSAVELTERYSWDQLKGEYCRWLFN